MENREFAFTKPKLTKLEPAEKRYEVVDTEQKKLVLRVYPSGQKT